MKINSQIMVPITLCAALFCSSALQAGLQKDFDTFLASPSSVARHLTMVPMRTFFNEATAKRSLEEDSTKRSNETDFYSQAMSLYITKIYNGSDYAKHLSQDGTHIIEFFALSDEFNLNSEAVYTGMRLFYNKLKEAEVIDDTVVTALLNELPSALENYFPLKHSQTKKSQKSSAKVIENVILTEVTDHLQKPKHSNVAFFRDLSEKIAHIMTKPVSEDEKAQMRERLRGLSVKFVELLISKMIWYPNNYQEIWQSVIGIAHNIHLLGANGIINHMDDIDDLLWSLVNRFNFFLEQFGSSLPISFYESIEHDISNHLVFFLESPELDEGITPKRDKLLESLGKAKAKAIAMTRGIITAPLVMQHAHNHVAQALAPLTMVKPEKH